MISGTTCTPCAFATVTIGSATIVTSSCTHNQVPPLGLQVEQSGRLPSHTFLDYSLTYLAFASAAALTLGQLGPPAVSPLGQSLQFLDQLRQDNWQMVLFALAGGTCLAFGGKATAMAPSGLFHGHEGLSKCTAFQPCLMLAG